MSSNLAQGLSPVRAELANGAVVLLQETSMTPAVTINASFRAGSIFDPIDLPGLAYLTGRLIDRGTTRRTAGVLADELDERGVSLRVSSNRTALTVSCTCLTEDFDDILAIMADVVRNPVFPEGEVEKRRSEALTTLRQCEDNPASRAVEGVLELLYTEQHPYGRPSKGIARGVARVLRADMVAFHHRRIRPGALTLAIVGNVAVPHALDRAAAAFDGWLADPPAGIDLPAVTVPVRRRERFIAMPGKSQTDIAYAFTTVRRLDPRYIAYWLMNHVLGQFGLGGRLADNIRERQGMAYYAYSTLDPAPVEAPLLIRAGVDPANVERTVAAIDDEVAALAASGPTATEVAESRDYLIGSIPRLLETNQSIAAFLQTCEDYGLGLDFDQRLPALLSAVTLDQVRAAAAEALDPARASIAIAGPA